MEQVYIVIAICIGAVILGVAYIFRDRLLRGAIDVSKDRISGSIENKDQNNTSPNLPSPTDSLHIDNARRNLVVDSSPIIVSEVDVRKKGRASIWKSWIFGSRIRVEDESATKSTGKRK